MAPRIRVYRGRVTDANASWDDGSAAVWDPTAFRAGIESTCLAFVDGQGAWLEDLGEDAVRLVQHARQSVSGGKRFRAAFCWWGHLAVAPPDDQSALLRACASLELLHASALVHDDYMDASDVRRGHPTTHRSFEELHRSLGWTGDAALYGGSAAILLGDLLLSWSDEMLRTCGLPAERVLDALGYFDLTRSEVVTGQFLDVSAQVRGTSDVDVAMTVVRYKSAKYSVERPLHIGAALAGGDDDVHRQLTRFGLPLGEAFQLRDDMLGVFGDPEVTGKPAGDDLREGKRTVLVALALDALPAADAAVLDDALGTPLSASDVARLQQLIDGSGAREQLEEVITGLTDHALTALAEADIDDDARGVLGRLAAAATQRSL